MPEQEEIRVTITGDADALAAALSKALEGAMNKSMAGIAASLRTLVNQMRRGNITAGITKGFQNAEASINSMARQLRTMAKASGTVGAGLSQGFDRVTTEIRDMAAQMRVLVSQGGAAGFAQGFQATTVAIQNMTRQLRIMVGILQGPGVQGAAQGFNQTTRSIRDMGQALGLTGDRLDEFIRDFSRINAPVQELRVLDQLQEQVQTGLRDMGVAMQRFGASSVEAARAVKVVEALERASRAQADLLQRITVTQRTELAHQENNARVAAEGITSAMKAANSAQIVDMQTSAAREVAITKRSAQQRVEIIRAVVGQIRALERGIAAIIRGGVQGFGRLTSAAGRAAGRLGSVFSRSDTQMATGLGRAMGRRETILRSSMSRQERIIQSSVVRQSAQFTRLETASSRGIAGVVSGRSQLGALLGGGLAIGGGFALISQVKKLATAGADFVQGLAVLDAQLGLTDRQMEKVHDTALELGNDISLPGVSALDAAQAIQILGKQFGALGKGAVPAALAASKGVLQLSRATNASAEDAARIVGSAVNVFGVEASKAVDVADQVAGALTKAAGVSLQDFALTFRQGAGVFAGFQVSATDADQALLDFNTTIAVLAKGGLVGSDAGTSLKQFFLQANRGTADSTKAMKELVARAGETGGAFFDAAHKARPLQESLDILRRGLEGMSDEARQKTLQKIFGSDAINAARLLVGTSEEAFLAIQNGIKKQGLAAEIAAAQNTGLRGAMDALNSVIETQGILVYEKLNTVLGNVVLKVAEFVNQLLTGEGAFATVRTALKGMAAGLGAILAAKGVTEIFRFLLILARGLLTPLGLISLLAAGVGAAFALMMDRSVPFRDAITSLQEKLGDFAGKGIQFVQDRLVALADFLGNLAGTVATFVGDLFSGSDAADALAQEMEGIDTRTLGEKLGDKFREIFAIVKGVISDVIGNLQEFFGDLFFGIDPADELARAMQGGDTRSKFERIGGNIRAAIGNIVDGIISAFNTARDAIQSFWDVAQPILAPAIDAIEDLAEHVKTLFQLEPSKGLLALGGIIAAAVAGFAVAGPLGAVVGGLGATIGALFATGLGDSVVDVLSSIGDVIINALRGPFETVKSFLADVFSLDNLKSLALGFLDLVEEIGRIIGSIVSDPRFVAAVAAIAAFAVTIGFRFIVGLGRGIKDNLGDLGDLLLDGLKVAGEAALNALVEVLSDPQLLLTAITAVFLGSRLISIFRASGTDAGRSFIQGFKQAGFGGALAGGGIARGGAPGAFVQALLGRSPNAEITKVMQGVKEVMSREIRGMRSTLQAAGRTFTPTAVGIRDAFTQMTKDLGPSGVAGAQLRARVKATFESLRTLSIAPLKNLGLSTVQIMAGIGKSAAGALAAGFAGFQTGQALAGQSGLSQVLGIGGLALALGAVNPLLGVAAGAAGIAGIAFGNMGEDASGAAERVRALDDALAGVTDPTETLISSTTTAFSDLSSEMQQGLGRLNFNIPEFVRGVEEGRLGQEQFVDMITKAIPEVDLLATGFRTGKSSAVDFIDAIEGQTAVKNLGLDAGELNEMLEFMSQQGGSARVALQNFANRADVTRDKVKGLSPELQALGEGFGTMFAAPTEDQLNAALTFANEQTAAAEEAANDARTAYENLLSKDYRDTLQGALDTLQTQLGDLGAAVTGTNLAEDVSDAVREASKRLATGAARQEFAIPLDVAVATGKVDLVDTRGDIDKIQAQVTAGLQAALDAGDITPEAHVALQAIVDKFYDDPALLGKTRRMLRRQRDAAQAAVVANAIAGIEVPVPTSVKFMFPPSLVSGADDGMPTRKQLKAKATAAAKLAAGAAIPIDVPVKLNPKVEPLDNEGLTTAVNEAFTLPAGGGGLPGRGIMARGIAATEVDVPVTINPLITVAGGGQSDIGVGIAATIAAGITSAAPQISAALNTAIGQALRSGGQLTVLFTLTGVAAAGSFAAGITSQQAVASAAASTVASAALGGFTGFSAFFAGADLSGTFTAGILSVSGSGAAAVVASGALGGFAGFSAYSIGQGLASSFASGIRSGISAAYAAGFALGSAAEAGARAATQTASPSKVFRNIGRDIGRGLAEGIRDSETDINSAVTQAVDEAIEAAQRRVPGRRVAKAALAAQVFERTTLPSRLPGGVPSIEVQRSQSDALDAMHALVELQREQNRELRETKKGLREEIRERGKALDDRLRSIEENAFEKLIAAFERPVAGLDTARQRIDLGGLRQQFKVAFEDLIPDVEPLGKDATEQERREHDAAVKRRDQALKYAKALDINTVAGRGAANMVLDFGQQIRDLGASMLEGGASARETIRTMTGYRNQLINAAEAAGINGKALRDLIHDLGLTDAQLARFGQNAKNIAKNAKERTREAQRDADKDILNLQKRIQGATAGSRSLGVGTAAGRENRTIINEALEGIREFGRTALEAGTPVATVVQRMKEMRNELVGNAVAMGFNSDQVQQLVTLMGLSNEQIAQFTRNLAAANNELENPPAVPAFPGPVIGPGGRLPTQVRDIHVHVPFGDPEAVALATTNRLAWDLNAPV